MKQLDVFLKLVERFRELISEIFFKGQEPDWLLPLINLFLFVTIILLGIWGGLFVISQIIKIWIEQIRPLYYNREEKQRLLKRQRFADHIEREIRQLNTREEWKDYRFTELEAEVEAEGRRVGFSILPFFQSTKRGLRREKSLSKSLKSSRERLILVEGEPGSGKSVALRHVAEKLSRLAMKDKSIKSVIPLYINLKKLERRSNVKINRELIESFVKQELNRVNDRDVEQFLDEEFQRGVREGTWLFLFDSFDELPEVLSSVEADAAIRNYAEAIDDFLNGFNKCRGIIASRQFRGPKHLGWPRFRILPLESRRWELIRKAELKPRIEKEISGQLRIAPQEIQDMTKNPMFLGILCEDMRDGSPFPENTHSVFENYLEKRLTRDTDRLQKRFKLKPAEVRTAAEKVAFCMSIDPSLGLSPTRKGIRGAMSRLGFSFTGNLDKYLNALEYLKLARSEEIVAGDSQFFTFAHRRFQEYFATCVVLNDLNQVNPRQLLTDGRWRETAVVIFQTQPPEVFAPILAEARYLLDEIIGNIPGLIDDPVGYVNQEATNENLSVPKPFSWPTGLLPLLGLLQDGFISRIKELPDYIQMQAGRFLLTASIEGTLADRKWSLEVAGITPQPVLLWLLRDGFASDSQWLKEVAYRQTARLREIPDDIAAYIRKALVTLFARDRLNKEFLATHAHLTRLDRASQYINVLRLLKWITPIDIVLHIGVFFCLIGLLKFSKPELVVLIASVLFISHRALREVPDSANLFLSIFPPFTLGYIRSYNGSVFLGMLGILSIYFRLIFFPFSWSIFAIFAANLGQFTHPFWWFSLLLFPVLYLTVKFREIIRFIISNFKKIIKFIISNFKQIALAAFLYWSMSVVLDWIINHLNSVVIKILSFSYIIAVFCIFLLGMFVLIKYFGLWLKDWIRWLKWLKIPSFPITAQELLSLITLYNHPGFSKSLIITIRERNSLLIAEDSEQLIDELALALESFIVFKKQRSKIKKRQFRSFLKNPLYAIKHLSKQLKLSMKSPGTRTRERINNYSGSEFFNAWLKQYTLKDESRLVNLGSEFLDEIYILLEQIRARRQNSSVEK
ncbi:MAG: NACHT domain-containing protein [Okeania sp. SIO3C4]|nr:NACHT domain-containing protein [Okeania sp. SIO3C4]